MWRPMSPSRFPAFHSFILYSILALVLSHAEPGTAGRARSRDLVSGGDVLVEDDPLQLDGLFAIQSSFHSSNWLQNGGWGSPDPCAWHGVYCDSAFTRVLAILLPQNNLVGTIPRNVMNLTFLQLLDLSSNSVQGTIPPELGLLPSLSSLDLSHNQLSGTLPMSIGNLTNLETLDVSYNNLTGGIPESVAGLSSVTTFTLRYNSFSGSVPSNVSGMTNLLYFDLSRNNFSGEFPATLSGLNWIWSIDVSSNRFTGSLPDAVGSMASLRSLSLSSNQFTGPFPNSITNLENLISLQASETTMSGSLPNQILSMYALSTLDLSYSGFNQDIPWGLWSLSNLVYVNLANNDFTGDIIATVGSLPHIQYLNLSNNNLVGSIPNTIAGLNTLQALDLHGNCIEAPSKSVLTLCQYIPCDFSPGTQCSSGSNLGFAPPSATLSYGDILAISVIASLLAGLFCVFFVLNKIPWEKIAIKLGLKKPQRVEMLQLSPNHRRRSGKRSTRSTLRSHDSREESRGEHQLSIPDELMERGSRSEGSPPPPSEVRLDVTDRSRMSRTTTPVKAFNEDEDDIPPPTVFVIPQNMLLTQVLASDTEEDLLNCFQKLKGFLEKAAKDTAVNDLLVSRGVKKRKQPTDIPRKEFLARCREHREENIMMWSREVRKAYQECLTLIEAQEKANKK